MTIVERLFRAEAARSKLGVILWWELRRIPYNLALCAIGCIDLMGMAIAGTLSPNPAGGAVRFWLAANVCYTAGWITELAWIGPDINRRRSFGARAFRAGLALSCLITSLPVWGELVALAVRKLADIFLR